jgi:hypothetical protein
MAKEFIPTRKDNLEFLFSHIEYEHIIMDIKFEYSTDDLNKLTTTQLLNLADDYGY